MAVFWLKVTITWPWDIFLTTCCTIMPKKMQCTYKRNIEARSRYHCCRGEAITIIYIMNVICSLRYPAWNAHAQYFIVIYGLSGYTKFSTLFQKTARFSEGGGKLLNTKCVFWFSVQLVSKTFPILRRIQGDIVITVHTSSCKVHIILVRY